MLIQALEKILAVILVMLALLYVVTNLPSNPQLLDWILPVLFAVAAVIWMLFYQGRQHQQK
jgi:hypothetical protein